MPDPSHTTSADLERIHREAEKLLRELSLDLEQGLMAFKDPGPIGEKYRPRLNALTKECDERAKASPHAAKFLAHIKDNTTRHFDQLVARARRIREGQGRVDGKLKTAYNDAVAKGLSQAPDQAIRGGHGALKSAIGKLVGQVLKDDLVPAEQRGDFGRAKTEITNELTRWIEGRDQVQDAWFVAEHALTQTAMFLHRQLTIQGQIVEVKHAAESHPTMSKEQSTAVDTHVGQLAKQYTSGEKQARSSLRIRPDLGFDPKFVLDPSKRFLSAASLKAGVKIEANEVRIEFVNHVRIINPLNFDQGKTTVELNPRLNMVLGNGWSANAAYTRTWKQDGGWQPDAFNAGVNYNKGNTSFGLEGAAQDGFKNYQIKAGITIRF